MAKVKTKLQKRKQQVIIELIIFELLYWVLMLAPISTFVIINRQYFFTEKNGLSITIGGCVSLGVAILIIYKKAGFLKGLGKYVVAFILALLFQSITLYLVFITGALAIGYALSMWFKYPIDKRKEILKTINKAQINAEAIEQVTINVKQV